MRVTLSRMWLYIATVMAVGGVTLGQNISEYGTLPMGNYSSEVNVDSGSLNVLFDMAEGFVNVVFPSFTKLVGTFFTPLLLSDDYLNYLGNEWQTLAQLEAGFITCVAFGLLFIVLVPIVGLVMCCCRTCCSNCGGKMKQSTKRSKSCWRQCLCASMLILATLMAIPTVFVFLTNEWVSKVVEDAPMTAKSILTDGVEYINSIDKQFDYVVDQYNVLDAELRSDLGDLGSSLGAKAEEIATDLATPTFGYLDQIIEYVDIVSKNVASISDSVVLLDQGLNTLDTQLKVQGAKMQVGLADCNSSEPASSPDPSCSYIFISAGNLGINIDSSLLVELVGNLNDTKDDLLSYNLTALRDDTRAEIDKISEKVSDETGSISNDTIAQLDEAKTTFDTLRDQIPLDQVDSYKGTISNLTDDITYYTTQYNDNFDKYRYIAGVVLGSILAVIVVSYYLGILLGTCGFKKRTDPSERGYTSNCGGIWLMVGVGLSFIFSWLLMILVLVLFAVGGHSERYVCQPVTSPYYGLQVIENNIPSFNLSKTLSVSSNVTFQNILLGCDENKSLYEVLSLKDLFDLDKLISDIEKEFEKVEAELNTTSVDLSSLDFYNDDIKNGIARVNESGIDSLNFTKYSNELNKTVTDPDLTVFAETLNATADNYTTPDHDKEANLTRGYSYEVLQIQEEYVEPLKLYVNAIRQNIDEIKAVQKDVVTTTTSLDAELQRLNTEIQINGGQLIVDALRPFVRNITDMVTKYMHWLKQQIEENFGACKPFSIVYNNTVGLVCDYLIDTMNGLWFSLGWCVFMLIPSAIVAMKLAKFYRRLHYQEDYEETNHKVQVEALKQAAVDADDRLSAQSLEVLLLADQIVQVSESLQDIVKSICSDDVTKEVFRFSESVGEVEPATASDMLKNLEATENYNNYSIDKAINPIYEKIQEEEEGIEAGPMQEKSTHPHMQATDDEVDIMYDMFQNEDFDLYKEIMDSTSEVATTLSEVILDQVATNQRDTNIASSCDILRTEDVAVKIDDDASIKDARDVEDRVNTVYTESSGYDTATYDGNSFEQTDVSKQGQDNKAHEPPTQSEDSTVGHLGTDKKE